MSHSLQRWHRAVDARDFSAVDALLHDDVILRTPIYWKPREGKAIVSIVLGMYTPKPRSEFCVVDSAPCADVDRRCAGWRCAVSAAAAVFPASIHN